MALRWCDSCGDYYDYTQLIDVWNVVEPAGIADQSLTRNIHGISVIVGAGRCGGDAIGYIALVNLVDPQNDGLWKTLDDRSTWIVAWAYKPANPVSNARRPLLVLQSRNAANPQVSVNIEANGKLSVYRGSTLVGGFVLLGTSTFALQGGNWYQIQFKVTIHNSTGSFELKVNGTTILSASGIDTQNLAGSTADTFKFSGIIASSTGIASTPDLIDDIVIIDDQAALGTENGRVVDFPGDVQVLEPIFPNANGALQDFTPNAGVNHFDRIDEFPPDEDTTYLEGSILNNQDSNEYENISTAFSIVGLQINSRVNKQQAGERTFKNLIRESVGPTIQLFNDTHFPSVLDYIYYCGPSDKNPFTGLQYTPAEINALQYGLKITV